MTQNEIFPNPTVKQVIFAIQFPNLFFIESKIGELQMKIMNNFPESALIFQRSLMLAVGDEDKIDDFRQKIPQDQGVKVWKFENPSLGYQLTISSNSLGLVSSFHKTYNSQQSSNRFRDIISMVLSPFFELTNLPTINRVGLRYIDECPFGEKTNDSFLAHFSSCIATNRFSLEDSVEHQNIAVVKRGEYFLRYAEIYNSNTNPTLLTLDFDGFANDVPSATCLDVTDKLHELIAEEYKATIKEPVYAYMRAAKNGQ